MSAISIIGVRIDHLAFEREITAHEAALAAERHINFNAAIELGRMRRQPGQGDVCRNWKLAPLVVPCASHDQRAMPSGKPLGQGVQEYLEAFRIR
jgi:hypothetical protein